MTKFEVEDRKVKTEKGEEVLEKGTVFIIRWLPSKKDTEKSKLESVTYADSFDEIIAEVRTALKEGLSKENMQIFSAAFEKEGYALNPIDPWEILAAALKES